MNPQSYPQPSAIDETGYQIIEHNDNRDEVIMSPSLTDCFTHHKFSLAAYVKEIQKEKLKNLVSPEYMNILFSGEKPQSEAASDQSTPK